MRMVIPKCMVNVGQVNNSVHVVSIDGLKVSVEKEDDLWTARGLGIDLSISGSSEMEMRDAFVESLRGRITDILKEDINGLEVKEIDDGEVAAWAEGIPCALIMRSYHDVRSNVRLNAHWTWYRYTDVQWSNEGDTYHGEIYVDSGRKQPEDREEE